MPYTVEQLFKDRDNSIPPTGIEQTAFIEEALNIMLKNQFSQLPVVDKNNQLVLEGPHTAHMVTNDSILRALRNLNAVPAKLRVSDAMVRVRPYYLEDPLSDLLKDLRDTYAVPIIGDKHQLVGVVTRYDTTEYFRKYAEDMMHIEQIEKNLKEYIMAPFTNDKEDIDTDALNTAISKIMPSNKKALRGPFQQALQHYLELSRDSSSAIKSDLAQTAFEKYLYRKDSPRPFDKLSFDDYIRLFVQEERWERYKSIFTIERNDMQKLLEDLRDIRNAFAHFRVEAITAEQRDKIYFFEEWFDSFHDAVMEEFQPPSSRDEDEDVVETINSPSIVTGDTGNIYYFPSLPRNTVNERMVETNFPPITSQSPADTPSLEVLQLEEEKPSDSRYAPLAVWLQEQLPDEKAIKLTIQEVEAIIGDNLPESAHRRDWWSNDTKGHVQSPQWLEVGWCVSKFDLREETVIFSRIKEREKAYIDFYSGLLSELTKVAQFHVRKASPDGLSWILIGGAPSNGPQRGFLGFSFARRGRFRVEFYIDSGFQEKNKDLYDKLYTLRNTIKAELADSPGILGWERMDDKRASRIALYHKGAITDNAEELAKVRERAVGAMIKFQKVIEQHVSEVV